MICPEAGNQEKKSHAQDRRVVFLNMTTSKHINTNNYTCMFNHPKSRKKNKKDKTHYKFTEGPSIDRGDTKE